MKESSGPRNQLKAIRTRLGLSQQDLAAAAGIARQTVGGIESELYAPSAAVALRLARALGCRVEEIFWLDDDSTVVEAAYVSNAGASPLGADRFSLAQVGCRWVATALQGHDAFRNEMIPADGVGTPAATDKTVRITLLDDPEALSRTVVLAGCTPALSLWARSAERWYPGLRVQWRHANSTQALESLARGEVHAAGIHLSDPSKGNNNASFVKEILSDQKMALVNLGIWMEGLAVQSDNPSRIEGIVDLCRPGIRLINREVGAGARVLLDSFLTTAEIATEQVAGYEDTVGTHHQVATCVASGGADAGVTTEAIAHTFGLDFIPLQRVRYDLAVPVEYLQHEPVQQLLSTLQHRWVRTQLSTLCGYDTSVTGEITYL